MSDIAGKASWIWQIWTFVIAVALIFSVFREQLRNGIFAGTGVTEIWTTRPGLLWIAFGLVILNSTGPYIGFKTESNIAMYSNMRTGGGVNNRLFMPALSIFHYQDDLVEGIVLNLSGRLYHGQDCIHALALVSVSEGFFSRFNRWVFRSQMRAALLYPVLRAGRNLALRILGRKKLQTD